MSNKSAQERPRASQERPRASQERLKSVQERAKSVPRAAKSGLGVSIWLHLVASGGSPAALGGRWRGGGEVNLSVNGIRQSLFSTWQPSDEGPADLVRCAKTAGPHHLGDRDLGGSSLYIAAGFGFRNLLGRLSDSSRTASRNEDGA